MLGPSYCTGSRKFICNIHSIEQHLLFTIRKVHACPSNFEVAKLNFELKFRNSKWKLKKSFESSLRLLFQSFVYFPNSVSSVGLQNKLQSLYKFQRRFEKWNEVPTWSVEVLVRSFISQLRDFRLEFRSLGAWVNCFHYKLIYFLFSSGKC